MAEFKTPTDIGNRALQHCGVPQMDPAQGFTEDSKRAREVSAAYGKLREAELQSRYWSFAIKRQALRAIDTTTMIITPALWQSVAIYFRGSIVSDEDGNFWISRVPQNLGMDPQNFSTWEPYFGPLTASLYDSTLGYCRGEIVYTTPGDATSRIYLSMVDGNTDDPATPSVWDATVTYNQDQVVSYLGTPYQSKTNLNKNNTPSLVSTFWSGSFSAGLGSNKWLMIGGAEFPAGVGLATPDIVYPIGSGPSSQAFSSNVFMLPAGYLRLAPQNPKTGLNPLGGPTGNAYDDWLIESGYLITTDSGPVLFRFMANFTDVRRMNAMFCEALAARIWLAVCQPLTQSSAALQTIAGEYKKWISDAKNTDAIENGWVDAPEDDLITVRR